MEELLTVFLSVFWGVFSLCLRSFMLLMLRPMGGLKDTDNVRRMGSANKIIKEKHHIQFWIMEFKM